MSKSNYVLAEDPATDLAVLEAFADELEEYIVEGRTLSHRACTPAGRRPDGPDVGRRPVDAHLSSVRRT